MGKLCRGRWVLVGGRIWHPCFHEHPDGRICVLLVVARLGPGMAISTPIAVSPGLISEVRCFN